MKKPAQHLIAEVPRRRSKVETTIGIDLGDVWSHSCTLNQDGEVVDRGLPNHGVGFPLFVEIRSRGALLFLYLYKFRYQ
jgi:hypothetical protein